MDYPRVFSEEYTVNGTHVETHYWRNNKTYWEKSWINGEEYKAIRISKERFENIYDNKF